MHVPNIPTQSNQSIPKEIEWEICKLNYPIDFLLKPKDNPDQTER
jgi:hypothetical protein